MSMPQTAGLAALDPAFIAGRPEDVVLVDAPINPDWIVSGTPVARAGVHSPSLDGKAATHIWECSAGAFWWTFFDEETVVILEGSVKVTTPEGVVRELKSGDIAYFAEGSRALWEIEDHVRKIAFLRRRYSPQVLALRTILGRMQRRAFSDPLPLWLGPIAALLPI